MHQLLYVFLSYSRGDTLYIIWSVRLPAEEPISLCWEHLVAAAGFSGNSMVIQPHNRELSCVRQRLIQLQMKQGRQVLRQQNVKAITLSSIKDGNVQDSVVFVSLSLWEEPRSSLFGLHLPPWHLTTLHGQRCADRHPHMFCSRGILVILCEGFQQPASKASFPFYWFARENVTFTQLALL